MFSGSVNCFLLVRVYQLFSYYLGCIFRECPALVSIKLLTSKCPQQGEEQHRKLSELKSSLAGRKIALAVEYSDTLHDRQVVFDSGWVVKIGRGLDIYRPPEGKLALGAFDLKLRKCLETTVDIFFQK